MNNAYEVETRFPVEKETVDNWTEAHPSFCSFKVHQKFAKKTNRVGSQLKDKLSESFEGPFVIRKVQSNGVGYDISKETVENVILMVNHRHLKPRFDTPKYNSKYMFTESIADEICDVTDEISSTRSGFIRSSRINISETNSSETKEDSSDKSDSEESSASTNQV